MAYDVDEFKREVIEFMLNDSKYDCIITDKKGNVLFDGNGLKTAGKKSEVNNNVQ